MKRSMFLNGFVVVASAVLALILFSFALEGFGDDNAPTAKPNRCDLSKVEKLLWCPDDEFLEKADLVKDEESGKEVCSWCGEPPQKVDACVKTYYRCDEDDVDSLKAGTCSECEGELERIASPARVVFRCGDCEFDQFTPGTCSEDEESDCFGKKLTRTCQASGMFPHLETKKISG